MSLVEKVAVVEPLTSHQNRSVPPLLAGGAVLSRVLLSSERAAFRVRVDQGRIQSVELIPSTTVALSEIPVSMGPEVPIKSIRGPSVFQ